MPPSLRAAFAALAVLVHGAAAAQAPVVPAMPRVPVVAADTPRVPAQPVVVRPNGERWAQITAAAANARAARFPIGRVHSGPAVLRVQVLLDRALFSPGMIDGRWGHNTQTAIFWMQAREGLPATGAVDSVTMQRLEALAGNPDTIVHRRELKAEGVRGPFTRIPENIYEQAKLACSCYESLTEKLTESFHVHADLLRKLNPGVKLHSLRAGDTITVPAVRPMDVPATELIAELWVSGSGKYVHAMSAAGRILLHFPTTLGSTFAHRRRGTSRWHRCTRTRGGTTSPASWRTSPMTGRTPGSRRGPTTRSDGCGWRSRRRTTASTGRSRRRRSGTRLRRGACG
jgi:hypothetical protein